MNEGQAAYLLLFVYGILILLFLLYQRIKEIASNSYAVAGNTSMIGTVVAGVARDFYTRKPCECEETPAPAKPAEAVSE